jgi:hypothetical protein
MNSSEAYQSFLSNMDKYIPDDGVREKLQNILSSFQDFYNSMDENSEKWIHYWNQVRIDGMKDGNAKINAQIEENRRHEIAEYGDTQEHVNAINAKYNRQRLNQQEKYNEQAKNKAKQHARDVEAAVIRLPDVHLPANLSLCSQPGFRCVRDTVFHDAFHTTLRTIARDTTFLNYGANAWTDYVPAVNAPAFDTAAFRSALDTLDTQKEIFGMDTLFTGYSISVEGLPDWASTRKKDVCKTVKDSASICVVTITDVLRPYGIAYTYPTPYYQNSFYLTNYLESPLEKDTLITWTLKYRYNRGNNFKNLDSLTITTLFRGI